MFFKLIFVSCFGEYVFNSFFLVDSLSWTERSTVINSPDFLPLSLCVHVCLCLHASVCACAFMCPAPSQTFEPVDHFPRNWTFLHRIPPHHHVFKFCVIISNNVADTGTSQAVIRSSEFCSGNATASVCVKAVEKTCEGKLSLIHVKLCTRLFLGCGEGRRCWWYVLGVIR
jgi:hypothetical protein